MSDTNTTRGNPHVAPYAGRLNAWQKPWGSKPTARMFEIAHGLGKRMGGVETYMVAMALRPEGVTDNQYLAAAVNPEGLPVGGKAHNTLHRMLQQGLVTDAGTGKAGPGMRVSALKHAGAYSIKLTKAGEALVNGAGGAKVKAKVEAGKAKAKADKPAKVDVKAKPKAAKPVKGKVKADKAQADQAFKALKAKVDASLGQAKASPAAETALSDATVTA